jgi:hypothetical protein
MFNAQFNKAGLQNLGGINRVFRFHAAMV